MCETSLKQVCLQTLRQLIELLAYGSAALDGEDAVSWHPSLLIVSAAMACIADAVCRRNSETSTCRLTRLLCGHLSGDGAGDDKAGAGEARAHWFGVGIHDFELASAALSLSTPELSLARTRILDYFRSLAIPHTNELFDFSDPAHYLDEHCATHRFFKKLAQGVYSHAADSIIDAKRDLEHSGVENVAFRDVMAYFQIFTLTCSADKPFAISKKNPTRAVSCAGGPLHDNPIPSCLGCTHSLALGIDWLVHPPSGLCAEIH